MGLLSFFFAGKESWGTIAGDGVIDLGKAVHGKYSGLQDFIGLRSGLVEPQAQA
jgi:hypothetical protein